MEYYLGKLGKNIGDNFESLNQSFKEDNDANILIKGVNFVTLTRNSRI
jgi:hypothetical protein